ncbi:MAG: TIGR01777 family oxidoreductase, partial [Verrucomicrobiae bacterium]|nr:TIGR01777 family oxidoreductase [Verrucomicrobiae bacterium]
MKIFVTGSHGLIGSALCAALERDQHLVLRAVRGQYELPEAVDAVVHLAGEPIAGRWTRRKKAAIRDSRVVGTRRLAESLARMSAKPSVFVCASAVGFYGDRGTEPLTEDSPPGRGFLAEVVKDWEAACLPAVDAGIRVVNLRFGVVLSARGGALAKMLPLFRLGLGGVVGSGRQFWSWVSLADAVGAILHALDCVLVSGPVNVVSPNPVTNRQFTKTLGRVLRRPTIFPLPAVIARLMLGEMATELLLASQQVFPVRLEGSGYRFVHRELGSALRDTLSDAGSDYVSATNQHPVSSPRCF